MIAISQALEQLSRGAAMCLVHSARDATKDIYALYEPKSEINALAKNIADKYCLPQDWLNDSVKGFMDGNVVYLSQYGKAGRNIK